MIDDLRFTIDDFKQTFQIEVAPLLRRMFPIVNRQS